MRANELMLGDWVQKLEVGGHYRKCRIKAIFDDGIVDCVTSDGEVHTLSVNGIEPIPLTAEILERNGFGKVLDEYGMECYRYFNNAGDGYIKISLYDGGACDWIVEIVNYDKFNDNEIDYKNSCVFLKVHELQHALRLCGIEKEIKL